MSDAIYIEITATRGSTPRDAGTAMKVTANDIAGTIGGGALEHQATLTAREMLAQGCKAKTLKVPLGPNLGQCCGGSVTLNFTDRQRQTDPIMMPPKLNISDHAPLDLWLWGAGHVGRAVVRNSPKGAFNITWVDTGFDRFPADISPDITVLPAADMPRVVQHSPRSAHHLIFTYSHDIDLALCAALLDRSAASIGLIGSDTKWARFRKRLRAAGLDPTPIICPIGDKSLGKTPDAIAHGCVSRLVDQVKTKELL
ncbi:molybdenum cofactor sulfurylase [Sulfitobacter marinus]|uniref:Molybdenum cofactor sulfurylase n=1 Tax=Sulfitobacter marinus TaxID=394264 RepID=A0A1I6UI43_9RHOB|nr:xanthine dehydrogenase accessory protein XdhC [Sulfitobacter marinus]SFT01139.1 molybdenum cofactor sulfurylase [Sulfitobacter marinus]